MAARTPLLAGVIVGAQIRGVQSQHVISTIKHFALNDQETGRTLITANIDEASARESDLLAFEIAIERGNPGAVMCAYNKMNTIYACENDFLLNKVLKGDWSYPGWVLSDWGAVHSTVAAANGGPRPGIGVGLRPPGLFRRSAQAGACRRHRAAGPAT